ncbi:MAG: hypothetical protein HY318_19355 [Armatimonadetes bacterium]|nr:hypothetical protein [Armatimonadota bacterium]
MMPSKTELFLDDELIEMTPGVTRKIHPPTKHRLNPVMRPEHWWEGNHVMPLATLYDPEEKLFKMWYRTGPLDHPEEAEGHASYTAYATSIDGLHWEKPLLGAVELAGQRDHNVVLVSAGLNPGAVWQAQGKKAFIRSVVRHPDPRDESEKYVCMLFDQVLPGAFLGYSADGIHWRTETEPFWRTLVDATAWGDDTLMTLLYDHLKQRWVMYRRVNPQESERLVAQPGDESWPAPDRGLRNMAYADSADLKHWENHRIIMTPDADDPADVEFYGFTPNIFHQVYVGYLWIYHADPEDETIDIQLTTSRDGLHFTRCCRREAFIPNGPPDYFDHEITVGDQPEPIILNDQGYIFYEACNYKHSEEDYSRPHAIITAGLCTFTRDRFVSLETGTPAPCRVVTKPLVVEHPKLFLNAATWGDGAIQVEVLARDWLPLEGYTAKEANVIKGNALNHPVCWTGSGDLGRLMGKEVRLKFNMTDARLHAMSFDTEDRPLKEQSPLTAIGSGYAELPVDV